MASSQRCWTLPRPLRVSVLPKICKPKGYLGAILGNLALSWGKLEAIFDILNHPGAIVGPFWDDIKPYGTPWNL
jgi:hypothetical protein